MIRARLLQAGCWAGAEPEPLRGAGPSGRQLYTMAKAWPELTDGTGVGIYQGLGGEKLSALDAAFDALDAGTFDALKPAALVFQHTAYGPASSLAIALGCQGPFWTLEADALSASVCVVQAMTDLSAGRCTHALVGSYVSPDLAWLMLLGAADGNGVRIAVRHSHGSADAPTALVHELEEELGCALELRTCGASDPHGSAAMQSALQAAQAGKAVAFWSVMPDTRGVLLGVAAESRSFSGWDFGTPT